MGPKQGLVASIKLALILVSLLCAITFSRAQESETDESFQDFHQDIGRISGGAPAIATQAPAVRLHRQPTVSTSIREPPQPARIPHLEVAVSRRDKQPRNRITLAVRPHTPTPDPRAELVSIPAPLPEAPAPIPITQPIAAPAQPPHDTNRFAALMARVAAERQSHAEAQPHSDSSSSSAGSLGSPLAALSSPGLVQVVAPPAEAQPSSLMVDTNIDSKPEEQIEAPTFQQVMNQGCPRKGVFSYENKDHCDRYYLCTNGTLTEEACPNGLLYGQMGAVYQHCAYNWNIDCGKKRAPGPLASPGCPWQFGIFPVSGNPQCSIDYFVCEWGVPETRRCTPEGLFYDDRIKGCQWADQLGCKSEALLNFKCPPEDEDNPFWPYPRYYNSKRDIIVCVNEQPRLVHCTEDQIADPHSLSCLDLPKKKKKL